MFFLLITLEAQIGNEPIGSGSDETKGKKDKKKTDNSKPLFQKYRGLLEKREIRRPLGKPFDPRESWMLHSVLPELRTWDKHKFPHHYAGVPLELNSRYLFIFEESASMFTWSVRVGCKFPACQQESVK